MWNDVEQAIANVQSHKTADGIGALRRPFANDNVRHEFAAAARAICAAVAQSVDLNPAQTAALVQVIANHRSKAHKQTVYAYKELAKRALTIADALAERPEALGLNLALKTILADHAHRSDLAAQALAGRQADFVAPKPITYARDPAYALVELTTPSHLQAESAALKHCVGTTHNFEALRAKGLQATDPGAEQYLHYAIKIRSKNTRIFSLHHDNKPCATIEYDVKTHSIVQIEGNPRIITGNEPFFGALCEVLHTLAQQLPLNHITGLPKLPNQKVLTRFGQIEAFHPDRLSDVLQGTIMVDEATPSKLLQALCASPRLTLDVSTLDLQRLPLHVQANLATSATSFSTPQLRTAGDIDARSATIFSAPQLQTARHIYARSATSFSTPQLRTAGDVYARSATIFSAPQLSIAGFICAVRATIFSAPQLSIAGDIDASSATIFSASQLRTAGDIYASSAMIFSAPQLESAGNIRPKRHASAAPHGPTPAV